MIQTAQNTVFTLKASSSDCACRRTSTAWLASAPPPATSRRRDSWIGHLTRNSCVHSQPTSFSYRCGNGCHICVLSLARYTSTAGDSGKKWPLELVSVAADIAAPTFGASDRAFRQAFCYWTSVSPIDLMNCRSAFQLCSVQCL